MGLVDRFFAPSPAQAVQPGPLDDHWYTGYAGREAVSGISVNADTALTVGAVFASVRVLSETLAMLPLLIYQRNADGGKSRASNHPLYDLLHNQPNSWQSSYEWREMLMLHLCLRGNAYCQIVPGPRGFVDQLVPLNPDRVTVERFPASASGVPGPIQYRVSLDSGGMAVLPDDQVFHLRGLSSNGVTGMSVVAAMRDTIGLAKATELYGASYFGKNAMPRGVLRVDGKLGAQQKSELKTAWNAAYGGLQNSHGIAVLEAGLDYKPIGLSPEDSQFLETRRFSVSDIARWFRVAPHLVGELDRATFSNIEQQSLEFVKYTMMPWFVRWEQAISRDLLLAPQTYFAEFLVDALLRGDTVARFTAYNLGRTMGVYSVNDIRLLENLDPLGTEGDTRLQPMNMVPLGTDNSAAGPGPTRGALTGKSQQEQHRALLLAGEAAARIVRREQTAVRKAATRSASDPAAWATWATEFYDGLTADVARDLHIDEGQARLYCEAHRDTLVASGAGEAERWLETAAPVLAQLALTGGG